MPAWASEFALPGKGVVFRLLKNLVSSLQAMGILWVPIRNEGICPALGGQLEELERSVA